MNELQWIELSKVLVPKLKSIYDTRKELNSIMDIARMNSDRGLTPSSVQRSSVLRLCEKLMWDMLEVVKTVYKDEKKTVEEFDDNLAGMRKEIKEYKRLLIEGSDPKQVHRQVISFMEAISTFKDSLIEPAFEELSNQIKTGQEKTFAEQLFKRLGVRLPTEEEERERARTPGGSEE